jgi:hypothetical protein
MFKEGPTLTTWSNDALRKTAGTDDLHISPLREDGVTYGNPRWIWSVAVDDALYVRAYNGKTLVGTGPRCTAGDHCRRRDDARPVRARRWADQRPRRRCLPGEVPWPPVSHPMFSARARTATVKVMPRATSV